MGIYTYGGVAPDEENQNEQCLEQTKCVNGQKQYNVTKNWSFREVVLIIRWFLKSSVYCRHISRIHSDWRHSYSGQAVVGATSGGNVGNSTHMSSYFWVLLFLLALEFMLQSSPVQAQTVSLTQSATSLMHVNTLGK